MKQASSIQNGYNKCETQAWVVVAEHRCIGTARKKMKTEMKSSSRRDF